MWLANEWDALNKKIVVLLMGKKRSGVAPMNLDAGKPRGIVPHTRLALLDLIATRRFPPSSRMRKMATISAGQVRAPSLITAGALDLWRFQVGELS